MPLRDSDMTRPRLEPPADMGDNGRYLVSDGGTALIADVRDVSVHSSRRGWLADTRRLAARYRNGHVVSKRIQPREAAVSASLLPRTARQLTVTEAGKALFEASALVLRAAEDGLAAIASDVGPLRGTL